MELFREGKGEGREEKWEGKKWSKEGKEKRKEQGRGKGKELKRDSSSLWNAAIYGVSVDIASMPMSRETIGLITSQRG